MKKRYLPIFAAMIFIGTFFSCSSIHSTATKVPTTTIKPSKEGGKVSPFYAYHTKLVHTSTDYFGQYADLIVVIGEGSQLEFTRRTGYLPKWVTKQGNYLVDDFFPGRDADPEFNYNYVRLIENSAEKIVVHWRYIPTIKTVEKANEQLNPTALEGFTAAVHEFFTIYPSGKVERMVKDARGTSYDSWHNPNQAHHQILELKENRIIHGSVKWGDTSLKLAPYTAKNRVIDAQGLEKPLMAWSFDEGGGDYPSDIAENLPDLLEWEPEIVIGKTVETMTNQFHLIKGHGPLYKKGVSGTALGFDGYYTGVEVPKLVAEQGTTYFKEDKTLSFKELLSLEAWVALDAYPYNLAPIIHQSENFGTKGFYLGIDAYGYAFFTLNGQTVKSNKRVEISKWTHLAGTFGNGQLSLYINGEQAAITEVSGALQQPNTNLMIGLNSEKERGTDYVRSPQQNIPFIYGIQGLIDEVKIYKKSLTATQIKNHYNAFLPQNLKSPLKQAILPGEVGQVNTFGATYKNLPHHELWDRMWRLPDQTDIVVKFDNNPASVVYWHGTNFAANWVTDNNRWMADQSSEIFTKYGCSEHMADKQTRHSYARIIENTPARVMIHWRYPNVDVGYVCTNSRNWSDEYYTIYPDGTAIRKVVYNNSKAPGFQDIQFFTNPGETALDVVHINAMSLANSKGETLELVWEKPNKNPAQTLEDATIEWLNSKSKWKVFTVFQGSGISTWGANEQSKYTEDPFAGPWNHWPVSMIPSDGRYATSHDRVTHFALGANDAAPIHGSMVHYGFTDKKIDAVIPKARFWQNPPTISSLKGASTVAFKQEEKAYYLEGNKPTSISGEINASSDSPVINPAFVIKNFDSSIEDIQIKIDGNTLIKGEEYRIGKSYDEQGLPFIVVWLKMKEERMVKFLFSF